MRITSQESWLKCPNLAAGSTARMNLGKNCFRKSFRCLVAGAFALSFITALASVVVAGQPQIDSEPEAIFTIIPAQPVINVPFRVDASQSFDRPNAGPIASYSWNWGDGTALSTGVSPQHTYTTAGRFIITLTVTDADSPPNTDTATKTVIISSTPPPPDGGGNRPPSASLSISPTSGEVGDEFEFDASDSSDADSDPLTYRFVFGDGEDTGFIEDTVVTHVYSDPGTYSVRLTVRDDSNASSDFTTTLVVTGAPTDNQTPVALIATGPRTGSAPANLSFDGRISFDPDGDPITHRWLFSRDGEPFAEQTGSVVNQLFSQPGTYGVVLEVTDSNDATGSSDEQTITITARGAPIEPPPPAPIPEPEPPPPSHLQRPSGTCGIGMLTPAFACLMGLLGGRQLTRKRA